LCSRPSMLDPALDGFVIAFGRSARRARQLHFRLWRRMYHRWAG
jgi:hypothetical protein